MKALNQNLIKSLKKMSMNIMNNKLEMIER